MKVKYFIEGITVIKKGMIDRDTDAVFFPKSLQEIEEASCVLDNHTPLSFFYRGTYEDWKKVKVGENNTICKVNFLTDHHIEKL